MNRRFNSYNSYFVKNFGGRVQKISIDAGFSCPNRDGKISTGGCSFCRNEAFVSRLKKASSFTKDVIAALKIISLISSLIAIHIKTSTNLKRFTNRLLKLKA